MKSNEQKILNLIKITPLFIIVFAFIISFIIINENNNNFQEEIQKIKINSLEEKKRIVKREVQRVYDLIKSEKNLAIKKLKKDIKERVYEAHSIAKSIYNNNQDKSKKEIVKLITDTLRDIRFNNDRGYFFIFDLNGKNILHPILTHLQEENLLDLKDVNGVYIVKEAIEIVKKENEGFLTWWWGKPNDTKNEYEKVGFHKYFEPFNWFIGTGEYVLDYEEVLKNKILRQIDNIMYGKNGYVFELDQTGTLLSHIDKNLINKNVIHLKDKNNQLLVVELLKISNKGEGYFEYTFPEPNSKKESNKITFIKGFQGWHWGIASGVYIDDIELIINTKKELLNKKNEEQLFQIFIVSIALFLLFLITSIYFTKVIKRNFLSYQKKVEEKNFENRSLNENLTQLVSQRTKKLSYLNKKLQENVNDLQKTRSDLITSEKMSYLGKLVSSVTHEINSPIGVSITSSSHLNHITNEIHNLYMEEGMSKEEFENFIKNVKELSNILLFNLNNTKELVNCFKNIAVDQAIEDKRFFNVKKYIHEILLSLKYKTKNTNLTINVSCSDILEINSYPGFLSQILINFINNSMIHGFDKGSKGEINITVKDLGTEIELVYSDTGKGILAENKEKLFNQYFTTKKRNGGTGLGLYIIKQIVTQKLNGTIIINHETNESGLSFLIKIPK